MSKAIEHYKCISKIGRNDNAILRAKDDIENEFKDNPSVKKGDELYAEFSDGYKLYARGFDHEKSWAVAISENNFHLLEFKKK